MKAKIALVAVPLLLLAGCSSSSAGDSQTSKDSVYVSSDTSAPGDGASSEESDSSDESGTSNALYEYPESEKVAFIENCNSTSNGQYDYCVCALTTLQRTYSWSELTTLFSQEGGMEEIQQLGLRECSWAIN